MERSERRIIAVAGPIGAGKSTLVDALAAELGEAATLHFDDYEHLTHQPAHDLIPWLQRGADFNEFHVPELAEDLRRLRLGEAVASPFIKGLDASTRFIVFEMPLGRAHAATAPFIDFLLWLETPPDIALARKLRDFAAQFAQSPAPARDGFQWMSGYLDNYLGIIREVLALQKQRIAAHADLLLDGELSPAALAQRAVPEIRARFQ